MKHERTNFDHPSSAPSNPWIMGDIPTRKLAALKERKTKSDDELIAELGVPIPEHLRSSLAPFIREGGDIEVKRLYTTLDRLRAHPTMQQHFLEVLDSFIDNVEQRFTILSMGAQCLNAEAINSVLEKFLELREASTQLPSSAAEQLSNAENAEPLVAAVAQNSNKFFSRAKSYLIQNASKLALSTSLYAKEVIRTFNFLETDLLIFGQLSKLASAPDGIALEQFKDFSADTIPTSIMNDAERHSIEELILQNKSADIQEALVELQRDLQLDSHVTFRLYRFKEKLAACIKTRSISEDTVYVGSFNAHPDVRGNVPRILATEIITTYGKQYHLICEAIEGSPEERNYIEQYGFVPTGKKGIVGNLTFIELRRPKENE